jgi:prolyl-tRNA synthetase
MMKNYISSYKDLPISVYQFQTKLRNEMRAKSGIMRGREFVMKDMYSFAADEASHMAYYESTKPAYMKVFERLGIGDDTFVTFAAGGAFTKFSHEFQTICKAGEDVTYINRAKGIAINEEVLNDETLESLSITRDELEKVTTAEVGNIFNFGQQKATDLNLTFKNSDGIATPVWMGSYGIGVSRLIGVLVEKFADDKGIVWPESVAPFALHLIALNTDDAEIRDWADGLYTTLKAAGVEVLYDDRDARPGEKFADSDLIGIPYRVVVSRKTKDEGTFELVVRQTGEVRYLTEAELFDDFTKTS